MKLKLPYGNSHVTAELPAGLIIEFVTPKDHPPAADPAALVRSAVYNPLGDVKPPRAGQTVAIAINDKTRPVPHERLLPPLLGGMRQAGVRDEDVVFIIATGLHPRLAPAEYEAILPAEILERYRVHCHDAHDSANLTRLGETARGTPVAINSGYLAADYRIALGNIEPHQFQGFSGGVKSAAIGLAGAATINHNHAMMLEEKARLGEYEANPARRDVEEIGRMIGVDFALNAILNSDKQIIRALAGHPVAVMRAGVPEARTLCQASLEKPFDLMIASPGGHPKDINMYQSQKGLARAAAVTKDGGIIILCAACPEGSGSADYENWMMNPPMRSHRAVLERFEREGFQVGRHKAFQISRDAARVQPILVSELDEELARALLFHPQPELQTAIDVALEKLPQGARIGVMPVANATMAALVAEGIR